jgi:2'-5' RNA ligase
MRLFVGIPLPEPCHQKLIDLQNQLRPLIKRGRLTSPNLFHMTLLFIGEVDEKNLESIKHALKIHLQSYASFDLELGDLGTFQKGMESIIWIGLKYTPPILSDLAKHVRKSIDSVGILSSDSAFKPHITLGRQLVFHQKDVVQSSHSSAQTFRVDVVHLYLSHQIDGRLTYTPLETYHLS